MPFEFRLGYSGVTTYHEIFQQAEISSKMSRWYVS